LTDPHRRDGQALPEPESSRDLLARARTGDHAALDRLYQRHLRPLRRWARGRLPAWARDVTDTDDLVQETLLRTLRTMDGFEPRHDGALQAYLRQALLNRIRDRIRRARHAPDKAELDSGAPAPDLSPLEEALGRETAEKYDDALERLREEEIILRVEMGYTYEDLAAALGKPSPDAARMAVGRALVRLAKEMNPGRR
jgi:RNA polymerase sigma-70 factor (ECF subfamily)